MIDNKMMSVFVILSLLILVLNLQKSDQASLAPIVDSKTGKDLPILTHTYYAIKNQKTQRYLIWFGKNGTVDSDPEEAQGKYWHIFEKIEGGWYKMSHHFGSHSVKLARSHQEGYYHIYNKDCFNGEHPNGDVDERGTIKCFIAEKGNMLEFNWNFLKKPDSTPPCHSKKSEFNIKTFFIIIFVVIVLSFVLTAAQNRHRMFNRSPARSTVQVNYAHDNSGFVATPVYPTNVFVKH